jgi:uncharacterized membrane protein YedE/YeeE
MSIVDAVPSIAAGAIFGGGLLASGVYSPGVIISQMSLTNFHMLQSFLSASAASAAIIALADHFEVAKATPRSPSTLNWFSAYDANILGGLLQGVGMTLTGACPGTVLVQIVTGRSTAMFVALGGLIGAMIYVKLAPYLTYPQAMASPPQPEGRLSPPQPEGRLVPPRMKKTLHEYLSISPTHLVLGYEIFCLLILASSALLPQRPHWLQPIAGGLLISLGQLASLVFTSKPVGMSGVYADIAKYLWNKVEAGSKAQLLTPSVLFGVGTLLGTTAAAPFIPAAAMDGATTMSKTSAVAGGAILLFGARLAGGCTSGHGISGMSMFSISSIITVISMAAGGIAMAMLLK